MVESARRGLLDGLNRRYIYGRVVSGSDDVNGRGFLGCLDELTAGCPCPCAQRGRWLNGLSFCYVLHIPHHVPVSDLY